MQVDDPAFVTPPAVVRRELAQIWATVEALTHLRQDDSVVEAAARGFKKNVAELAVRSLAPTTSQLFDDGFWQTALVDSEWVDSEWANSEWAEQQAADLQPIDWSSRWAAATPVDLMAEVLGRIAPDRAVVAVPVMAAADQPSVRGERSQPGWLFTGRAFGAGASLDCTHCAVFAIDEGDNEILGLVPVDTPGLTITSTGEVRCDGLRLSEADVITGEQERALLEDRLTLLGLGHMLRSAAESVTNASDQLELALAGAAMDAATAVIDLTQVTQRSRGVSAAVTCVQPACVRIAGLDERFPEQWHQQRLVAFL